MRIRLLAPTFYCLLGFVLGGAPLAKAQTRVLFVGNSFTHGKFDPVRLYNAAGVTDENYGQTGARAENYSGPWGGIPGIFKKFADQAGLLYEVHIESISGQPLEYHYNNALAVSKQASWNQVVLQDQSTYPLPSNRTGNRTSFYTYATKLEQAIHGQNAQTQVYLYETWARADMTYPSGQPYSGLPIDTMFQDLHNGYYAEYRTNGKFAAVAPAGDAWLRAIQQGTATRNPYSPEAGKINLWGSDYYHPGNWGSYLNALVLFCTLTGVDPRTLGSGEQAAAALGISAADATALQQVAYQQVNPAPLPVQLVAFSVNAAAAGAVALSWQTASEATSAYFEVERSLDGVLFAAVTQVAAAGTSPAAHRYAYLDREVPARLLYYRLRQVDQDGTAAYSPTRTVLADEPDHLLLIPNPAVGGATQLQGVAPGASVWVLDALGQVRHQTIADQAGSVRLGGLSTGFYLVRTSVGTVHLVVE
ncbi:MAG: T9SS type A sorting domain-containing protein [Janthinobacterium lividum]